MITIPTLKQLYDGYLAAFQAELQLANLPAGKVFLRALAAVLAGTDKLMYLAIGSVQKNIFVDTADPEALGGTLERFGRVKLGRNPTPPRAAQYELTVTGSVGGVVPASQTFKSNDDSTSPGMLYVLDVAYTLTATTDTITVRALSAGLDSKLVDGDKLTATSPIPLVDAIATVTGAAVVEPLAGETLEEYRAKALQSFRLETQGGAATDYRLWALDAAGVVQAYPYASSGAPNEVDVYVEANINDGVPTSGILDEVAEVIEFNPDTTLELWERGRRPLGVFRVNVLPVTLREVGITITNYGGLNPSIETQISDALASDISKIRPYVPGADVPESKNDILDVNRIISVILQARPGSVFDSVGLEIDGVSVPSFTFTLGDIPKLIPVIYA
jgi:uncharacterized phage protein gp47/JayE